MAAFPGAYEGVTCCVRVYTYILPAPLRATRRLEWAPMSRNCKYTDTQSFSSRRFSCLDLLHAKLIPLFETKSLPERPNLIEFLLDPPPPPTVLSLPSTTPLSNPEPDVMRPSCLIPVAATLAAARSLAWPRADDSSPAPVWRHPHAHSDASPETSLSKSVYHIIAESERGTRFAELLEDHEELHKRLTDDGQNITVFVPVDEAFRRLNGLRRGGGDDETSAREVLEYHVLPGRYSLDDVAGARTLSTMLEEGDMGGRAQRLRVSSGLSGVEINFYSRVVGSDSVGLRHAVRLRD